MKPWERIKRLIADYRRKHRGHHPEVCLFFKELTDRFEPIHLSMDAAIELVEWESGLYRWDEPD